MADEDWLRDEVSGDGMGYLDYDSLDSGSLDSLDGKAESVDAKKEKITDAARVRAMPTPQVGPDAYEIQHAKRQAINTSASPIRGGTMHSFDAADAFFTASPAIVKDAPENYQGIKPNVGADSYMIEHAKEAAENLPATGKSREMSHLPPEDPNAPVPMEELEA